MPDYLQLPVGDHLIEETGDWEHWVHRSQAGWSEERIWKLGKEPVTQVNERSVREKMQQALVANATYLALTTPTAAQTTAQVKLLTRECSGIIRFLLSKFESISDT